jgi:hypothetical protein
MKKFQIFSTEKDRKIAWLISVIFLSVAWLVFAAILVWAVLAGCVGGGDDPIIIVLGSLLIAGLILIPIQLVRYFRQK